MEEIGIFLGNKRAFLFLGGAACILVAIMKGGITFKDYGIPKLETNQSIGLGVFGLILIIFGLFFSEELKEKNNPPVAEKDEITITLQKIGKTKSEVIDVVFNDRDKENDKLTISPLDHKMGTSGNTVKFEDNKIRFNAKDTGTFIIPYKVNDGKGNSASTDLIVTVILADAPDAKIVPRYGKLMTIFKNKKGGEFKTSLKNVIGGNPKETITANFDDGRFSLHTEYTEEEFMTCTLSNDKGFIKTFSIENDTTKNTKDNRMLIEFNPLEKKLNGIKITFCNNYKKSEKTPEGVFTDTDNIPFSKLKKETIDNREYGILHLGLKFRGNNTEEERGKLTYQFKRTDGDKISYHPFNITSGSYKYEDKESGWRSHLTKRLLPGSYKLLIRSINEKDEINGEVLKTHSFTIVK